MNIIIVRTPYDIIGLFNIDFYMIFAFNEVRSLLYIYHSCYPTTGNNFNIYLLLLKRPILFFIGD